MIYNDDDNQYKEVTNILKQLPKVDAPPLFEADLMRRINSGKFKTKEEKVSFWEKLLSPSRLVPSAAVALIAVIMLFVVNTSSVDQDDPLSLNPRVREDLIEGGSTGISLDEKMDALSQPAEDNFLRRENQASESQSYSSSAPATASFASSSITKNGLNFRQINLSEEERQKLNELKEKFKEFLRQQSEENKQK